MRVLLLSLVVAFSISCKSHTKTATAEPVPPVDEQTTDSLEKAEIQKAILQMPVHRLVVSFISIGEGTFPKARGTMDQYIFSFEQKNKVSILYASRPWGREGESDHYFALKELSEAQQAEFVNGMRDVFKGNSLILIEENRANTINK